MVAVEFDLVEVLGQSLAPEAEGDYPAVQEAAVQHRLAKLGGHHRPCAMNDHAGVTSVR